MNARAPFIAPQESRGFDSLPDLSRMFQQYVEATPMGILVVDYAGTIVFVNRSLCSTFGYQPDELVGQPIEILVPDGIKPDHVRLRDSYIENPVQRLMVGREVRGRRKDGTEVAVAIGLNPMVSNGSVQVACTVMDLTSLKQAERTLERFFDLSLDLFCVASTDGHFLRINPNFSRLLGYSDDELLVRPFLEFVHPDDIAATQAAVAMLKAGQSIVQFRNRYGNLQGDYHWIEWSARSIPENGLIFAVGRDVTDEVRLSQEIKVREQRERAILDNTPAVVYLKDTAGRYLYVNQRHTELFEKGHETLIGKTDEEIFPAELAEKFVENDRTVIETSATITTRETAPHPDGLHTYVSVKFPLLDANGAVSAVAGISTDITEQLHAQQLEDELRLGSAFQQKLFPQTAPLMSGLELAGAARPVAKLCGDYYDFIVRARDRIVLAVGDVSGHGTGPALAMMEVRAILRGLLSQRTEVDLPEALQDLNRLLADDLPEGAFVSLFLAEIDVARKSVRYAGAGHEAMVMRAGQRVMNIDSTGPLLGLLNEVKFENVPPLAVREGDVLLICTDGVTEAMNPRFDIYGRQRLTDCLAKFSWKSPTEIIQCVFSEVGEFASGRPISDDMTAVVAKIG